MTLTRPMRDTLEQAARQELRRVHDTPRPEWPAHHSTLAALVRHGLLAYSTRKSKRRHEIEAWAITDSGRDALQPREVFRQEPDYYLARGGSISYRLTPNGSIGRWTVDDRDQDSEADKGYTTNPATSSDRLPRMAPPDPEWKQRSEARRAHAQNAQTDARKLARQIRAA
jgi:DNA-binding PadR family transcriptional regulator